MTRAFGSAFTVAGLVLLSCLPLAAQEPTAVHRAGGFDIAVVGDLKGFTLGFDVRRLEDGLEVVALKLTAATAAPPPLLTLKWSLPSQDVAGQWATGRHLNKTLREVTFFSEPHPSVAAWSAELRLDRRRVPYWTALRGVSDWWAAQPGYAPAPVPEPARLPVYSTWYNYHQSVDAAVLLKEVTIAKKMGFESIIVDDGWQTLDTGRGYAFTGDWEPERIPDMKGFVDGCHALGVKVILWYAVPFVGKNAKVAARFKDKSLRYEDRLGAYVVDPRYPEVRQYLASVYRRAIRDWGIDGFKLDFIERLAADERTVLDATQGRDFASVNEAADRMMTDVLAELRKVKPDVMIEFRQPYIGPLIRKYGNMFRASDCPNSYLANRVKTVDLRLLTGETAVHADMIMWHYGEPVELAAFQLLNVMFSVPQVSVRLQEIPRDHFEMVRFYTDYWRRNRAVLLDGAFEALSPSANYPVVRARRGGKQIVGLYADAVVGLDGDASEAIDVLNAKSSKRVVLAVARDLGRYRYSVRDRQGRTVESSELQLGAGARAFAVPVSGLLSLERMASRP